jgi:hypothetical protein
MFVLTSRGQVFLYKIKQTFPKRDDIAVFGAKSMPKIIGELLTNEQPILIKDLNNITMMSTGLDHVMFLDNKG